MKEVGIVDYDGRFLFGPVKNKIPPACVFHRMSDSSIIASAERDIISGSTFHELVRGIGGF